ncbi:MAG: aminotransferase class I/II-fold pyridoxal phosphate-dependent enzyme, partial [Bacteroidales bacterium]
YLVNKMRSFIFSTALPPINIEWSRFIIEKLSTFTAERENLSAISKHMRDKMLCTISSSHIVTYVTSEATVAVELSHKLKQNGFYALPVRPPTVPQGESGIRFSLTAAITKHEIDEVINTILKTI